MSASTVHPTAVIEPGAALGEGCVIGPYCIIGKDVELGDRCRLHSHVVLDGHTRIGSDNEIFPFACIGLKTQDLKWRGGVTRTQIGSHNTIREHVTIHSATADGEVTVMGSHNTILAYCHLAHNVELGSRVIMSNVATLAGHVIVEDHAVIGGLAAVHQFCRIGKMSIVGGCSKVVQDVPPFMMADGNPAQTRTINKVGMERNGVTDAVQSELRQAYKILFREGLTIPNAMKRVEGEVRSSEELAHLLQFIRSSKRGIGK